MASKALKAKHLAEFNEMIDMSFVYAEYKGLLQVGAESRPSTTITKFIQANADWLENHK